MTDRLDRIESILDSVAKSQAEFDREMKESRNSWEKMMQKEREAREASSAEWDKQMKKEREARQASNLAWEKEMREEREARQASNLAWEKEMREERRLRKETNKKLEGYIGVESDILEDFFFRALAKDKKVNGIKYHFISADFGGLYQGQSVQIDIALINDFHVFLVEVKHQPRVSDFKQLLKQKKAFPHIYPQYAQLKIHLGLAGEILRKDLFKHAKKYGIYLLQPKTDGIKIISP